MSAELQERLKATFPQHPNILGGKHDVFDFAVESINLVGGDRIPIQRSGVTAIVGANNAGKSTILSETWSLIARNPDQLEPYGLAVESLTLVTAGSAADLADWLGSNSSLVRKSGEVGFQRAQTGVLNPNFVEFVWPQVRQGGFGALASFLGFYGNAQGRFGISASAEMRDSVDDAPTHPVHRLEDSKPLLDEVSALSQEIFRQPLTLDLLGRTRKLRVGDVGLDAPRIDDIPQEYRERMAALRPLDEQGDGMRSLMGQLLPLVTASYKLLVIDEPEAFLHPPQAHALGSQLGKLAVREQLQIVLATHDRNLLAGLLESGVDVSVVRLTREVGAPRASHLDADQLKELWSDPVLRYTNVLDGLFHRLVVVAEGDRDCGYLAAALDCPSRPPGTMPRNEILFVPTGGKDGMAKVCSALSAVGVPVVAAPDLDMLADKEKLASLVRALGSSWTREMEKLWSQATAGINARREPATVGEVLEAINAVLTADRDLPYTDEFKRKMLAHARTAGSRWAAVKDHGMSAFKGQERGAADDLLRALDNVGVVLLAQGELEGLAPEVTSRKGAGWLQAALAQGAQCNAFTQSHLDRILASGNSRPSKTDSASA